MAYSHRRASNLRTEIMECTDKGNVAMLNLTDGKYRIFNARINKSSLDLRVVTNGKPHWVPLAANSITLYACDPREQTRTID